MIERITDDKITLLVFIHRSVTRLIERVKENFSRLFKDDVMLPNIALSFILIPDEFRALQAVDDVHDIYYSTIGDFPKQSAASRWHDGGSLETFEPLPGHRPVWYNVYNVKMTSRQDENTSIDLLDPACQTKLRSFLELYGEPHDSLVF